MKLEINNKEAGVWSVEPWFEVDGGGYRQAFCGIRFEGPSQRDRRTAEGAEKIPVERTGGTCFACALDAPAT
jgi:hypothetical protein